MPPAVWTEFRDLQEWERYRPERPEGDKHFAIFESVTEGLFNFPGDSVVATVVDAFLSWARKSSVSPVTFGLACCAIEMTATFASRFDVERLGMVPRASPRHSDLIIASGTVTIKMAPMLKRIYDQMPDPKWAVSMGSYANSGGPFRHGYYVVKGVDRVIPVDVYVRGCPPPSESLLERPAPPSGPNRAFPDDREARRALRQDRLTRHGQRRLLPQRQIGPRPCASIWSAVSITCEMGYVPLPTLLTDATAISTSRLWMPRSPLKNPRSAFASAKSCMLSPQAPRPVVLPVTKKLPPVFGVMCTVMSCSIVSTLHRHKCAGARALSKEPP